jgi:serine/threonine protein kinase
MAPEMLAVDLALRRGTAISPEMIAGLSAPALDIFSLGRILYFLLTGVHPSSGFQFEKLESFSRSLARPFSAKKGTGTKRFQMRKNLSTGAQALIVALTAEVASERPAAASPAIRKWLLMMELRRELVSAQVLKSKKFHPDVDSGVLAIPVSEFEERGSVAMPPPDAPEPEPATEPVPEPAPAPDPMPETVPETAPETAVPAGPAAEEHGGGDGGGGGGGGGDGGGGGGGGD